MKQCPPPRSAPRLGSRQRALSSVVLAAVVGGWAALSVGCSADEGEGSAESDVIDVFELPDLVKQFDSFDTGLFQDGSQQEFDAPPLNECRTGAECLVLKGAPDKVCQEWVCAAESRACLLVEALDGLECDDHNECTTASACSAGLCLPTGVGSAVDCFDGNPCTSDDCDPAIGCVNAPTDGGPCNDGNDCTVDDWCNVGVCEGGADTCPAQCGNGVCEVGKGEGCDECVIDCGQCSTGCDASQAPGCPDCACEGCVCDILPACCQVAWTEACATLCGSATCGGTCTGCQAAALPSCHGCDCEECVCALEPSCCASNWSAECAAKCDTECGGCSPER